MGRNPTSSLIVLGPALSTANAETGEGRVKRLRGEFEGLLRLRVGNHRVLFDETEDTITVHRVRDRKEVYRD